MLLTQKCVILDFITILYKKKKKKKLIFVKIKKIYYGLKFQTQISRKRVFEGIWNSPPKF